jgi:hypothetical protein
MSMPDTVHHEGHECLTHSFRTLEEFSLIQSGLKLAPASWSAVTEMRGRNLASAAPLSSVLGCSTILLAFAKRCRASLARRSPKRFRDSACRTSPFRLLDFVIHSSF